MTCRKTLDRAVLPVVLGIAVALSGCATGQSDYGADVAELLQSEVLEVSELSSAADYASALLAVAELEVALKDARARGLLTEERYDSILAAAAMVRTDLEAAIAAQTPPEPAPEPNDDEDDEGDDGNSGNDNPGKGNGGNNGKGNSDKGNSDD